MWYGEYSSPITAGYRWLFAYLHVIYLLVIAQLSHLSWLQKIRDENDDDDYDCSKKDKDYVPHGIPSRQAIRPPPERYSRRTKGNPIPKFGSKVSVKHSVVLGTRLIHDERLYSSLMSVTSRPIEFELKALIVYVRSYATVVDMMIPPIECPGV